MLDGDVADVLLAAAHTPDGVALFEVDPQHSGVTRRAVTAMDATRRLAVVRLDEVPGRRSATTRPAGGLALAAARDLPASRSPPSRSGRPSGRWS